MKNLMTILSLGGVLLAGGVAYAQPAAAPATTPPVDTTVTTTTTTSTDPIGAPGAEVTDATGTMPTTGGAPLVMVLSGGLTAASAFFLRRKLS